MSRPPEAAPALIYKDGDDIIFDGEVFDPDAPAGVDGLESSETNITSLKGLVVDPDSGFATPLGYNTELHGEAMVGGTLDIFENEDASAGGRIRLRTTQGILWRDFNQTDRFAVDDTSGLLFVSSAGDTILQANNSGNVNFNGAKARILPAGAILTKQNAAPADASIGAGEVAIWFDSTNGASKVKFKGKSANGTVVQGEVALS